MLQSTKTDRLRDEEGAPERPSWMPRPSARQLAAMRERAPGTGTEVSLIAPAPEPAAAAVEGLGDFRNLADSIAQMRSKRSPAKPEAEADAAEPTPPKPRSWLDEVREDVERRRVTGDAEDERATTATPMSDAAEIARLRAMMEALQARVTRLEAENARLSPGRLRLTGGERAQLSLTAPANSAARPAATARPASEAPAKSARAATAIPASRRRAGTQGK